MSKSQKRKIKVMHITHGLGGIQTYLQYVLKYSDKTTFDYVIAAPANETFESFCAPHATYYPLRVTREINVFTDGLLLIKLIRLIKKEKPDVLHVHSAKGGFLGRLAGLFSKAKLIYTPHGFSYLSFTGGKRMLYFMLERAVRNRSNMLLAVSYSEAGRARFELGYDPGKIKVIPNSIPAQEAEVNRNYDGNFRIGMIGRLTIQKNPMLFLEIASVLLRTYPHLQFKILGAGLDDHLGRELRAYIAAKNLSTKIELLPWGSGERSAAFLKETDIFVMTSVFEGLPYSLLEAMDAECACVVSKADGNNDVIQNNENGFACNTKEEYCDKIGKLINDKALRQKFGTAGRDYVHANHNILSAAKELDAVYAGIL